MIINLPPVLYFFLRVYGEDNLLSKDFSKVNETLLAEGIIIYLD